VTQNDFGTEGEPAFGTENPPPPAAPATTNAPVDLGPNAAQYAPILASYDQQIAAAQSALQQAAAARDGAQQRLTAIQANPSQAALFGSQAQTAYDAALTQWRTAADQLQTAYNNQAQGKLSIAKTVGTPQEQAKLEAEARAAQFQAQKVQSDVQESQETRPERIAQIRANSANAQAQADLASAQARLATATEPFQIQQAQQAVQQASLNAQRTQAQLTTEQANAAVAPRVATAGARSAESAADISGAQAGVAPRVAAAGATSAEQDAALKTYQTEVARATTPDEIAAAHEKYQQAVAITSQQQSIATQQAAIAGVAPERAQADLRLAQSNADQAALQVQQLQANLNATTDADRRRAIQLELSSKQTSLDAANQQLDLARRTADATVRQVGANVASTEAGTQNTLENIQKNQLGALYGAQQRAREIGNMIASGQIGPEEGTQLLHDHLTTAIQGTTPFELGKFQTETDTSRRTQDVGLAQSKMSDYTSATSSLYNTFTGMNAAVEPGSDAAGRGLLGAMNIVGDRLQQYGNVPNPPMSPLLQSVRPSAPAAVPVPAGPPPAAASGGGGHQITINIGGGADTSQAPAMLPAGDAGTSRDPRFAGLPSQITPQADVPAMLQQDQPATPDHVAGLWDPSLVQQAMQRMTAQDAQARAAV
jgi:hypothetical protein